MAIHRIKAHQLARLIEERGFFHNEDAVATALKTAHPDAIAALVNQREDLAAHILSEQIGVDHDDEDSVANFRKMQKLFPGITEKDANSHDSTERYRDQREVYIGTVSAELRVPEAVLAEQFEQDETVIRGTIARILEERIKPIEITPGGLARWNKSEPIAAEVLDGTISDLQLLRTSKRLLAERGEGLEIAVERFIQQVMLMREAAGPTGPTPGSHGANGHDGDKIANYMPQGGKKPRQYKLSTMDGEELVNIAIDRQVRPMLISKGIKDVADLTNLRTAREDLAESMLYTANEEIKKIPKPRAGKDKLAAIDKMLPDVPEFDLHDPASAVTSNATFHSSMGHAVANYTGTLELTNNIHSDEADRQFRHDYSRLRRTIKEIAVNKLQTVESKRTALTSGMVDSLVVAVGDLRTSGRLPDEALVTADTLLARLPAVGEDLHQQELKQDRRTRH